MSNKNNNDAGKRKVSALISSATEKLKTKIRFVQKEWPQKGGSLDGIKAGQWVEARNLDDTGWLPSDCPVRPLGYEGECFYFVDTSGQVFATGDKPLGVERMQKLFAGAELFLCWGWPKFSAKNEVTGFAAEDVRRDLFGACQSRGSWSATQMVRGRGAWRDDQGQLILHCGEYLWMDGKAHDIGEVGDYFYVRRPATFLPWSEEIEEVEDNPAIEIFELLETWNMVRDRVDAMLILGWIGVALMGAALDWRPSIFLVGDAGTGKSELQNLLKAILGKAMIATTNATEAGLYQIVGHDSLPIAVDEMEGEEGQGQALRIIKMARDAASGSMRIRGGADHKGVEFEAKSTFSFSAINPPGLPPASMTRLAMIQLRKLKAGGKKPVLKAPETVGPRLLRRVADHWDDFQNWYERYQEALGNHGHDSRGENTFGTFLAAAHLLLGDKGMEKCGLHWEDLDQWGFLLEADSLTELSGKQANWHQCIEDILISQIDAFKGGEKETVGQVLAELARDNNLAQVRRRLASTGLGVLGKGLGANDSYALAVPISGRDINKLLANTSYTGRGNAGSWASALGQGPEDIILKKLVLKRDRAPDNRVSIGGTQRRCLFIDLEALKEFQEKENGDEYD